MDGQLILCHLSPIFSMSRYAAPAAAPYLWGFIHLDLDEWILDVESEAPK